MSTYAVLTIDPETGNWTPQIGVKPLRKGWRSLRLAVKQLRDRGYSAHRTREPDGSYWNTDPYVLIQRVNPGASNAP